MPELIEVSHVQFGLYAVERQELRHPWHELVYTLTGTYLVEVGRQLVAVPAGRYLVHRAGTPHALRIPPDNSTTILVMQWREDSTPAVTAPAGVQPDPHGRLLFLLRWLADPAGESVERRERIFALILDLVGAPPTDAPAGFADRVRYCLEKDHPHPLCIKDLADTFGLSVPHFIRRFRAETGTTPGQALQRIRVDRAHALIVGTDLDIGEITRRVGFTSPSYVARLIRDATGRTPTELREGRSR